MLYGLVNKLGGMDIAYGIGLPKHFLKFVGKSIALPDCWLPVGTRVKASVTLVDKRPIVVDYVEIKND